MEQLEEIVKEISSNPSLNKESIIDEVKNALPEKDPNTYNEWREDKFNVNHVFCGQDTLLHLAAEYGNTWMVEVLIRNGANINEAGHFEETHLHYAARFGEIEVMKILIENGANINAVDEFERTPLYIAVQEAPRCLKTAIVKVLIENGTDVNVVGECGKETPLHSAVTLSSNIDTVRALVENGASVNVVDCCENTPLHLAAQYDCTEIVKILIGNGANINAINKYDEDTPLDLAVKNNHLEVVKYLTDKGADIHAKDINRKVPLDHAREKGYGEIVEYLTDKIAKMPHNKDKAFQVYQDENFVDDAFLAGYYTWLAPLCMFSKNKFSPI